MCNVAHALLIQETADLHHAAAILRQVVGIIVQAVPVYHVVQAHHTQVAHHRPAVAVVAVGQPVAAVAADLVAVVAVVHVAVVAVAADNATI